MPKAKYMDVRPLDEQEYEFIIQKADKDCLAKALKLVKKYRNNPILNGKAPVSTRNKFIHDEYLKDYKKNHRYNLHYYLSSIFEGDLVGDFLDEKEEETFEHKELTNEQILTLMEKVIDKDVVPPQLIAKLFVFDFDEYKEMIQNKIENYQQKEEEEEIIEENQDKHEDIKKLEAKIEKLTKQNEKLASKEVEYNRTRQENKNLQNTIKAKDKEIQQLKNKLDKHNQKTPMLQDVVDAIMHQVKIPSFNAVETLYENIELDSFVLEKALEQLQTLKKQYIMTNNYERIKDVLFLEYIIVNTKEIEHNG